MSTPLRSPLLFSPNRKTLVWGTEDWTVSAVPGSESIITHGDWAGQKLNEVIAQYPAEILGREVAARYGNQLPLLAKIIDAHQDLSIQVHPNDEMAKREHNKLGKSEMWYILEAEPGATLLAGFKEQITPEEFKEMINPSASTSGRAITDVLARHSVQPGDVFYLPAGRVHAICGGIKLAEIQQSSDVTYRIFDYNRPGLDGKPRELHTALASQAIDYTVYPEYKSHPLPTGEGQGGATKLLNTPYFSIKVVESTCPFHRDMRKYDSFIIQMNLGPDCLIRIRSTHEEILLPSGSSSLIPALLADYDILPLKPETAEGLKPETEALLPETAEGLKPETLKPGSLKVLEAYINNQKSISKLISDFFRM